MRIVLVTTVLAAITLGCEKEKSQATAPSEPQQPTTARIEPTLPTPQTAVSSRPEVTSTPVPAAPVKKFDSVSEILNAVPENLRPNRPEEWSDLKLAAANNVLAGRVLNHPALIQINVDQAEITPGGEYAGLPRVLAQQPIQPSIPESSSGAISLRLR